MTRRRWMAAAALLVAAALVVFLAATFALVASLYSVTIDLLEIATLPHDV